MGLCKKTIDKWGDYLYLLFRVLIGVLFALHGYDKLFVKGMEIASLMGFVGLVELLVGLGILLGIFTRLAATGGAITMLVAYFKVHAMNGLNPLVNKGELAILYFAAFLVLAIYGNGIWSLEKTLFKKEKF